MPIQVLIGTAIAAVLLVFRAIGPHEWRHPTKWRIPEAGPSLIVWFGANAATAAVRLAIILVQGKVGLRGVELHGKSLSGFDKLGADDATVLFGGALAAFLIGLATIRDGMRGVVPLVTAAAQRAEAAKASAAKTPAQAASATPPPKP